MGDARHKRPPRKYPMLEATPLVLKQIEAKLAENALYNEQHRLKKGQPGYRPHTHADLTAATKAKSQNAISNLLGGAKGGTKTRKPTRSRLVVQLMELLGIPPLVRVDLDVPKKNADLMGRVAVFSGDRLAELEQALDKIERGLPDR
jgi:hypothetical protein